MKIRVLAPLLALGIIIIGVGAFFIFSPQAEEDSSPSNEELISVIIRDHPLFAKDGKPVIEVARVTQPSDRWYVVGIKSIRDNGIPVPVHLVYKQDDSKGLHLVIGPGNYFKETDLLRHNVPDSVIIDLQSHE